MTSMQQDLKVFQKNFLDSFVILVSLLILSHYPDIDISNWLSEKFQRITDKAFREKLIVLMASTLSDRTFLTNFFWLCLLLIP